MPESDLKVISCTGNQYCNFAMTETKQRAEVVRTHLEPTIRPPHPVTIGVTGCPNSCTHYQIVDVGLHGVSFTQDGEKTDGYYVLVGGRLGANPALARFVTDDAGKKRKFPADTIHLAIERLLSRYEQEATSNETFYEWVSEQPIEAVGELLE